MGLREGSPGKSPAMPGTLPALRGWSQDKSPPVEFHPSGSPVKEPGVVGQTTLCEGGGGREVGLLLGQDGL